MIDLGKYPILNCTSTLKQTSKDENSDYRRREYMTESQANVINFDKVKEAYAKKRNLNAYPKSNDALYLRPDKTDSFIEFKNGYIEKGKEAELKEKIYDSLLMLMDIIDENISYTRENLNYILVYNEEKNREHEQEDSKSNVQDSPSMRLIEGNISKRANERIIRFGLEKFKGYCFNEVATYTKEEFEREFVDKLEKI